MAHSSEGPMGEYRGTTTVDFAEPQASAIIDGYVGVGFGQPLFCLLTLQVLRG